jgi:hypothetical protein
MQSVNLGFGRESSPRAVRRELRLSKTRQIVAICGIFGGRWHEWGIWWQKVANCGMGTAPNDHFPPTNTGSGT